MTQRKHKRFKVTKLSETVRYAGVITAADLRKKFGIPDRADITVTIPSGGDWSGETIQIGTNEAIPHITVEWEEVK